MLLKEKDLFLLESWVEISSLLIHITPVLITSSIKNPEGGNIPAVAGGAHNPVCNVLPVNGLGTTWFKKIDVKLNGTTVSFDGNMYSHRADIENRLSYPDTVKKGHLSMMGFDEEMKPLMR